MKRDLILSWPWCPAILLILTLGGGAMRAAAQSPSPAAKPDSPMRPFVGSWEVDVDRTLAEAKDSPKHKEEDAGQLLPIIRRTMESMKVRVTTEDLVFLAGGREMSTHYVVTSATPGLVTVQVPVGDTTATLSFRLLDGRFLNFRSSATDDMDFYAWKRVP